MAPTRPAETEAGLLAEITRLKAAERRLRIALDEIAWMQEPTYTLDDAAKRARKELL